MSTKSFCDRCRKEITKELGNRRLNVPSKTVMYTQEERWDLCANCYKFVKLIIEESTKEGVK